MTLVLAIRAVDGVVIASDGAETISTSFGQAYARQESQKLHTCRKKYLWAAAGTVGVIQRIEDALGKKNESAFKTRDAQALRQCIAGMVVPIQRECKQDYTGPPQLEPSAEILFGAILESGASCVVCIDGTGSSEVMTGPHLAIGSGAPYAMATMERDRRDDWRCATAEVVAVQAVTNAISVAPGGIGPPISVGRLCADNDGIHVDVLTDADNEFKNIKNTAQILTEMQREAVSHALKSLSPAADAGDGVDEPPTPA